MADMTATPSGERLHIAFFGRRNAGKSSLVNAFTGQEMSIVSEVGGTTTDPVSKAMELLPLGPVQIIDTPGIDDEGTLGTLRVRRTRQILNGTDLAILVTDGTMPLGEAEQELIGLFDEKSIPYILVRNKADLLEEVPEGDGLYTSALTGWHVHELKELAAHMVLDRDDGRMLVGDLLDPGDTVVLVVPIDKAAPKGRLILPQQQTIRDVLDHGCPCVICRDHELVQTLEGLRKPPKMVITDSQVFGKVSAMVPEDILLTSFSILMARYKGDLELTVAGARMLDRIRDGDRILISEGCSHHRQCGDIGTQKLPGWIREHTGAQPEFTFTSGKDFPEDLSCYRLVIHCGGCMLTQRQMRYRQRCCMDQGVPITNYGIAIAHMKGILERSLGPFRLTDQK